MVKAIENKKLISDYEKYLRKAFVKKLTAVESKKATDAKIDALREMGYDEFELGILRRYVDLKRSLVKKAKKSL